MDVNVETLPDLDIVILRGRDRDVEELARIIEELERLSAEAEPEIEVYPLRHVRGTAWRGSSLRLGIWSAHGRGESSITPLEKPNSLLLIGWGEALNVVKQLIRKLDQPVSPETQLEVFTLRNSRRPTNAADSGAVLRQPPGAGTAAPRGGRSPLGVADHSGFAARHGRGAALLHQAAGRCRRPK